MDTYQKNLELLQKKNPSMAIKVHIASSQSPAAHPRALRREKHAEIAFFTDLVSCYEDVKKIITQKKVAVVIETDLGKAKKMLCESFLAKLLQAETFFWHTQEEISEEFCLQLAWTYFFKSRQYFFSKKHQQMRRELEKAFCAAELIACEYKDYGLKTVKNLFANKQIFINSQLGTSQKLDSVAILCGAGPSLERSYGFLKQVANKAWIFAGGSALEFFAKHQIPVDVACAIDPDLVIDGSKVQAARFFYSLRCNPQTAASFSKERFVFPGSGESLLEQKLWETVFTDKPCLQESGWTVGNFMATCAVACGISHVVFVGMDMVYRGGQEYANTITARSEKKTVCTIIDKDGKKKKTRQEFLAARAFYEELIQKNPQISFYNLDPSGLVIEGAARLEPCQLASSIQQSQKRPLSSEPLKPSKKKVEEFFLECKASFFQTQRLSKTMLEKAFLADSKCKDLRAFVALEEHDLEEQMFYQLIFLRLWDVWQWKLLQGDKVSSASAFLKKLLFLQDVIQSYTRFFEEIQ